MQKKQRQQCPPRAPKYFIYGLVDPRDLLIHYVGLSSRGMRRPREHRHSSNLGCGKWVKQLQAAGLDYEIVVLEELPDDSAIGVTERWWIAYGKACGWPLENLNAGGGYGRQFRRPVGVSEEDMYQAKLVNLCNLFYKKQGAEVALEIAQRGGMSTEISEWFKAMVFEHCLAMSDELPLRLICPCGKDEPFFDSDSLTDAVMKMIDHITAMRQLRKSEASQKRRWMLHLTR